MAVVLALAVGCAEASTAPEDTLQPVRRIASYTEEGSQNPPDGVPPEYQFPTILYAVEPHVAYADAYAYGEAIVRYFGTNALAKVTLTTNLGERESERETSQLLPAESDLSAQVQSFMGSCLGLIHVKAYGKVWNEFFVPFSFLKWGAKSDTRHEEAECGRTTSTGGDRNAEGGTRTCYELEVDHYWYYPATGRVEYRYTSYHTWCEGSGQDLI